jgi:large subunit ribosomal protein LP1
MASLELAATYAARILADEGMEITADTILAVTEAASDALEPSRATLLAKPGAGTTEKHLRSNSP